MPRVLFVSHLLCHDSEVQKVLLSFGLQLYNFFNSMMTHFSVDNANQVRIIKAFSEEQRRSLSAGECHHCECHYVSW